MGLTKFVYMIILGSSLYQGNLHSFDSVINKLFRTLSSSGFIVGCIEMFAFIRYLFRLNEHLHYKLTLNYLQGNSSAFNYVSIIGGRYIMFGIELQLQ